MPQITIRNGVISTVVYVQVTRDYVCDCGTKSTITMSFPEGVSYNGAINIEANCPSCDRPVAIPKGHHYIEDFKLLTKPLDA